MSDPKSYGEPVEEPTEVDDVVGRAEEALAEAEAAGRVAVDAPADTPDEVVVEEEVVVEDTTAEPEPEPVVEVDETVVAETVEPVEEPVAEASAATAATTAYEAPTAYEPTVTPSEPSFDATYTGAGMAGAAAMGQPIFVQAPEAPRPRGNRAAAGAIGVLAALSFGVLYLATWLGIGAVAGDVTVDTVGASALEALGTWMLWVPVVVFYIAFWLLGAIINRGRWGSWVIFGLLVGIAAWGGHILGQLFQAPFWTLTAAEGAELVEGQFWAPLAIVAFVLGRELTIWFGAWAAARGKRVTELNIEAQREYERTLEAGPQLVRMP
jgi:hypothetical protein